ncbi:hypothetical protein [Methylorubrum aminovorans]
MPVWAIAGIAGWTEARAIAAAQELGRRGLVVIRLTDVDPLDMDPDRDAVVSPTEKGGRIAHHICRALMPWRP